MICARGGRTFLTRAGDSKWQRHFWTPVRPPTVPHPSCSPPLHPALTGTLIAHTTSTQPTSQPSTHPFIHPPRPSQKCHLCCCLRVPRGAEERRPCAWKQALRTNPHIVEDVHHSQPDWKHLSDHVTSVVEGNWVGLHFLTSITLLR